MHDTHSSSFSQTVFEALKGFEFDIAKSLGLFIPVLDDLDALELYIGCVRPVFVTSSEVRDILGL